jgi:hypothetical protein
VQALRDVSIRCTDPSLVKAIAEAHREAAMADTETWKRRVASWRASGQTAVEFSARHGFAAATLRWWSSRLKGSSTAPAAPGVPRVRLARVVRRAVPPAPPPRGEIVVDLLDLGARVTVEAGAKRETLQVVLAALGVGGAR